MLTSIEICAGAGGQALGLERAGFFHVALVEYEQSYCNTLKLNRPNWNVICADVKNFSGEPYRDKIDLFAGGVPCPPFSVAGRQLGSADERDLFPEALRLIEEINPRAVMLENVRGFLDPSFSDYRDFILNKIDELGYNVQIKLLNASDYGVPQLRPRVVIVGIRKDIKGVFSYIAPTIVGGSKKHGGPDLGPVRARKAWAALGVDGLGIANEAPQKSFEGMPRLTPRMIARIQGFPDSWDFGNKKTAACRMIGNAFPPPVAQAVGEEIKRVLEKNEGADC